MPTGGSLIAVKTLMAPLRWAGYVIGVTLAFVVVLIPAGLYIALWYRTPLTFWPVLGLTAIGGPIWVVLQIVAVLCILNFLLWLCSR
ncbi:MAG: hypothetical protein UY50_C0009G0003 [Parcubacteria group bacterium GW2011_GWA2_49_9]|nr:MAG: hypothetical protein UY50_C0009G0003 [Parcubacteria group bacterium GW2011_GWA2_49_9]